MVRRFSRAAVLVIALLSLCGIAKAQFAVQSQTYNPITAPPTPTFSTSTLGGSIAAGTYRITITYFTSNNGESLPSADTSATIVTTGSTSSISVVSPPAPITGVAGAGTNVVGYRVYFSAAGGGTGSETLQTLAGACTLSVSSTPSCALGANYVGLSLGGGAGVPSSTSAFSPNLGGGPSFLEIGQSIGTHHITWATSGTASSCTFTLDTSADGVTWTSGGLLASTTCTSSGATTVSNITANYVRLNVTALTSSNATAVVAFTYTGDVNSAVSGVPRGIILSTASITPAATSAAIQTVAQAFTLTGLLAGDQVILIKSPAPTSLCPPTQASAAGANSVNIYFTVLTASACTPVAGVYVFEVIR